MSTFLWAIFIVLLIDCIARIYWLASGNIPQRTPASVGWDLASNFTLLAWAIVLLVTK